MNRFERNMKPDRELKSSATWTNTDQILIRPTSTESYDFYIDDIIFSNSRTITHNVSSGKRQYMSDSNDQPEDTWYHFDHLGNVANLSDSSGDETEEFAQDAFGNVLSSTTTGAWASSVSGRHLTTKEYDGASEMYYFYQRWYDPEVGRFISKDPVMSPILASKLDPSVVPCDIIRQYANPYLYCLNNPINYVDTSGGCSSAASLDDILKAVEKIKKLDDLKNDLEDLDEAFKKSCACKDQVSDLAEKIGKNKAIYTRQAREVCDCLFGLIPKMELSGVAHEEICSAFEKKVVALSKKKRGIVDDK
jgi:RHS repeat-associated protein